MSATVESRSSVPSDTESRAEGSSLSAEPKSPPLIQPWKNLLSQLHEEKLLKPKWAEGSSDKGALRLREEADDKHLGG